MARIRNTLTYESTAVTEMAGRLFITNKVEELQKIIQEVEKRLNGIQTTIIQVLQN